MEKITDRINQAIDAMGISKYKFCKDLGFSVSFLSRSRDISTEKYISIVKYLKDVNPQWLLTGEGEMFNSWGEKIISEPVVSYGREFDKIALLDILIEKEKEILKHQSERLVALKRLVELIKKDGITDE